MKALVLGQKAWDVVIRVKRTKTCVSISVHKAVINTRTWLMQEERNVRLHYRECEEILLLALSLLWVELVRNLMAHAQKPHFVFRRNGQVHLNRRGSQFSRLLAAKVCASALVMLDTPRSEVVWEYWLHTPFASFPFTSPPVRHHVPPHSESSIPEILPFRQCSGHFE